MFTYIYNKVSRTLRSPYCIFYIYNSKYKIYGGFLKLRSPLREHRLN